MKRMLIAMSAACVPLLSVAAPPSIEPVDVNVTNSVLPVEVSNADPIPVVGSLSSSEATVELYDDFLSLTTVDYRDNPQVGPIDIKGFKTVRVVLRLGSCGPCGAVDPRAYIRTVGSRTTEPRTIDKVTIDNKDGDIGRWASRSYDVAGTSLVISFEQDSGARSTVRAIVFGRAN